MSKAQTGVEVTNHAELSWYKRQEATGEFPIPKIKRFFREAIPIGASGTGKRAKYHPPSGLIFIYAHEGLTKTIVTLFPYGSNVSDRFNFDHLHRCDACEKLFDPALNEDTCRWCGELIDDTGSTPVPQLSGHPNYDKPMETQQT